MTIKFENRILKSFSMAEMLMVMVIVMTLLVATFPLITLKKKTEGMDTTAIACIKNILVNNPGYSISESDCSSNPDSACCVTVNNCVFNLNNSCITIKYYADNGKSNAEIYAARKLFREICDRAGQEGCRYFVDLCNLDSASCDVSNPDLGADFDLNYYLGLTAASSNFGMVVIEQIVEQYYNYGYSNITSKVDLVGTTCICPNISLACGVKGTTCNGIASTPWEKRVGGANDDQGYGIAVESAYVYITGGEVSDTSGGNDIFATKMDPDGNIIWKKKFGGSLLDRGRSIAVESGNVYITGQELSDSAGVNDIFAIKLDPNGNVLWKKKFGGTKQDYGYEIAADSGNVYLSGYEFSDSAGATTSDLFAIKLDANGNTLWMKKFGGIDYEYGYAMTVESGNVYLSGADESDSAGGDDIYAIKLDTNGNVVWKKKYGGLSDEVPWRIAVESGNAYITGRENTDSAGLYDIFAIKLDANGNVVWKKKFGGANNDEGIGIAVESGNAYITGYENTDSAGLNDIFAIRLDVNGNVVWKKKFGGTAEDYGLGIAVESGNVYLTGYEASDSAGGDDNIFVIKLSSNQTSNLNSSFDGANLSSDFNGNDLSTAFNGSNMTLTTGDLNASFDGANLKAAFNAVLMNKTVFLGFD